MRDLTPSHVIEVTATKGTLTPFHWKTKHYGRPNAKNLRNVVATYNESTEPGGCNAHLEGMKILTAAIVKQATGETVASETFFGA